MEVPQITGPGYFDIEVVGESHYQKQFIKFCGGRCLDGHNLEARAHLFLDNDNQYDNQAVAVLLDGEKVGHLPRDVARDFRRAVIAGDLAAFQTFECAANIRGGWDRGGGDHGQFGIWLDLPQDDD